jgi:DNA-binding response OmpR family regulator
MELVAGDGYRVRILGTLEVFSVDGVLITSPADRVMQRILVALALRAGQPRSTKELIATVWPGVNAFNRHPKSLETPISRLRAKLRMPIPPRRGLNFYRLDLPRHCVDALDFIDSVRAESLDIPEISRLLALWRGDPRVIFADVPDPEWAPLMRAVDTLAEHLNRLSATEARQLGSALDSFGEIFPEIVSTVLAKLSVPAQRQRKVLIVENDVNVAKMFADILFDYQTIIAVNLEDAMRVVTEQLADIDGALIDLHLTDRLDSAGLEILAYIRDRRPDLPRLLITASPPPGSQEKMRQTYGIMDTLIKGADGYSTSGVRDAVGLMFDETPDARRRRAFAEFESHVAKAQRRLMQQTISARRGIRSGDRGSYRDLEHWAAQLDIFEADCERIRLALLSAAVTELDGLLSEFLVRWPLVTKPAGVDL